MSQSTLPGGAAAGRYYSLDALRGAMMALGIVIHAAMVYSPVPDIWWIKDPRTSQWMDMVPIYLHTFRLPVFFVMAGFFAAMLAERRGWRQMVRNRLVRLGLPLILGVLFIVIPLKLTGVYCQLADQKADPWAATLEWAQRGNFFMNLEPGHLWFLETLIWVTLLALVCRPGLARLASPRFLGLLASRWGIVLLAVLSSLTLLFSDYGLLDTPHDFTPHWRTILAYSVFYAFGWGVYLHRNHLCLLHRFGRAEILAALVLLVPLMIAINVQLGAHPWSGYLATAWISALMGWLMVYGLIGCFMRRFSAEDKRVRYLADASFWIYAAHPLALLLIQVPLLSVPWNPWVKFSIALPFACVLMLWSYDRWVRASWVGLLLNGRRFPRWGQEGLESTADSRTVQSERRGGSLRSERPEDIPPLRASIFADISGRPD